VAPNLTVRGVNEAIEFYRRALPAELLARGTKPNGMPLHTATAAAAAAKALYLIDAADPVAAIERIAVDLTAHTPAGSRRR